MCAPVYLYIRKPKDRPAAVYHSATAFTSGGSTGKKSEKKALWIVFNRLSLFMLSNSSHRRQLVYHLLVKILWCCCCCDQTNYFVLFKKLKNKKVAGDSALINTWIRNPLIPRGSPLKWRVMPLSLLQAFPEWHKRWKSEKSRFGHRCHSMPSSWKWKCYCFEGWE